APRAVSRRHPLECLRLRSTVPRGSAFHSRVIARHATNTEPGGIADARARLGALMATGSAAPRVAIVHSWLNQYGGAERVLEQLHELFPAAPIYTSMFEPKAMPTAYQSWDIRTSFLQRVPLSRSKH